MKIRFFTGIAVLSLVVNLQLNAQEDEADSTDANEEIVEEIVVTGTHIRGADISGILPVTVIDSGDIDAMGVDSGDELLEMLPEQGQNFFNEEESISGGVNAARGDVGAFNLRNIGTGNTLVLLNGRRLVNAASYQTEEIGGSFVPVNSVNSNTTPVFGIERVELLKDGASAIYGADAVAGVVNTVLKNDVEGLRVRFKYSMYDNVSRETEELNLEWGRAFNDGRTNVSVLADLYLRDPIHSSEDDRWANSDIRHLVPEDSPWFGSTSFRNSSANSLYGQFDIVPSVSRLDIRRGLGLVDGSGEFHVYQNGDERCGWTINYQTCGVIDGMQLQRYNLNEFRDLSSDLQRGNIVMFINHEIGELTEAFSEVMYYKSDTVISRHPSAPFSTVKLRVGAENYYNPFGPCGSDNRLPEDVIGNVPCDGLPLLIDNFRLAEVPRIVENDGSVYRLLQGFRGSTSGGWDWETAAVWSKASRLDLTRNRVSNTLIQRALNDPTPAAYNPFSGGVDSNIEQALVNVTRKNETTLFLADFRMSRPDLFEIKAGTVGAVAGIEVRREAFKDNRDPLLDGTQVFTDLDGDTYPFVSDVVNSSPTPDSEGSRRVTSVFGEVHVPITDDIDAQVALRYEDFSDVGDAIVGKVAGGWQINDMIGLRASWSESFRVPNLITVNEDIVARQNTRNDYTCLFADPEQDILDCRNSTQRVAEGSDLLVPERSENYSIGVVLHPIIPTFEFLSDITLTTDLWSIVKNDTIGLLGEENHTVYDLLLRLNHGAGNCDALVANPAVLRVSTIDDDEAEVYSAAGICPAGDIVRIEDLYENLDTRTLNGVDLGVYFTFDSDFGRFRFKYLASLTMKFEQEAGGAAAELVAAHDSGVIPASIPVTGFADLIQRNGNQKYKSTLLVTWVKGVMSGSLSSRTIGEFYQDSLTLDQGTADRSDDILYWIPAMTTWNARFDYRVEGSDFDTRYRIGIRNLLNERAPLADRYFGFFSDVHRDYGRSFYVDVRFTFD